MPSSHFVNLESSILELKRVYLDEALSATTVSPDHQELARAFLMFVHSELEFFVEEALRELAQHSFNCAISGSYGRTALALITFSGLEPLHGGSVLGSGKKKQRQLATRFGHSYAEIVKRIDGNCGVREKHLAQMAVPLGLDASSIDNTWLNELDAFCSKRGAFAHISRTNQRGSHLAVNPQDIWSSCKRVVWTDTAIAVPGIISSFQSLDDWIDAEKSTVWSTTVIMPTWRLRLSHLISVLIGRLSRKLQIDGDDD
jgi:hypothetical protein